MISVIVPVYNVTNYISRCVESVLCQSMQDFELILVDDGSTDGSGEICDSYANKDDRICVIHQENQGLSAARNRGLKEAKGEYIAFIDSDDYIDPAYLEVLYRNAADYKAEISVCSYRLVWEQPNRSSKTKAYAPSAPVVFTGKEAAGEIVRFSRRKMITAWGKLYRNNLKQWLNYPAGRLHEDEFVTYRVMYAAERVVVSDEPYYQYVQRGGSIMSGGYGERRLDKLVALKEAIDFFAEREEPDLAAAARKRYALNIQIAWYRMKCSMQGNPSTMRRLEQEWKELYHAYKAQIMGESSLTDKISLNVFKISPPLYGLIAGIYQRIVPEV
ncbi:glycosyltransferase family 2 protein [Lachnotalea sp. AF33-28]|uniref:glycosyltransferase family 2 protein n=1 Tax=Lachnotalea sp. AF33-28 TaxID=2292046 RepID=UPI000E4AF190|nr:glycosyltransferase [Lachnotalea sp. AF33-28]RHP33332.1 glycosyltransferase [Lachnotalea sp. AF33-28]